MFFVYIYVYKLDGESVNYLSHFLLTEKLMPLLRKSPNPKVVQVSSRFHLAVDGSDLSTLHGSMNPIASQKGGSHGFFFFRSQRQYANSKLAQILHARAFRDHYGIRVVSSCPTWVGTQIGAKNGTVAHSFFESTAFPFSGFGLSSILHAMFDTESDEDEDFYINTDFGAPLDNLPSWTYRWLPIRDILVGTGAFSFVFLLQRFFTTRTTGRSSIQSYNKTLYDELFIWSRQAVAQWL